MLITILTPKLQYYGQSQPRRKMKLNLTTTTTQKKEKKKNEEKTRTHKNQITKRETRNGKQWRKHRPA